MDKEEFFKLYIGEKFDYYLNIFNAIEIKKNVFSLNIVAIIFDIFWLAYRKMYLNLIFIWVVLFIENMICIILKFSGIISLIAQLITWILFGLLGNYFYYKHVQSKFLKMQIKYPDYNILKGKAIKSGGISISNIFILIFITVVIPLLIAFVYLKLKMYKYL